MFCNVGFVPSLIVILLFCDCTSQEFVMYTDYACYCIEVGSKNSQHLSTHSCLH